MTPLEIALLFGGLFCIGGAAVCGSGNPTHEIGDSVSVYYDPNDPKRAEILGEGRWLVIGLGGFGLAIIAISAGMIIFVLR